MSGDRSSAQAGFTLIELVVALALFALVSLAGLALVDSMLRVEERTAGRLERLGALQRAMFVITRDLEQISGGTLEEAAGGLRFERHGATIYEPGLSMAYAHRGDALFRVVGAGGPRERAQLLMRGVSSARWSFFLPGRGWAPRLPQVEEGVAEQPSAVALDLVLGQERGPSGTLRRVVELPTPPAAPPPAPPSQPAPDTVARIL